MFGDEFDQEQEDSQAEGQDPRLMQTLPEQGYQAMPQQPVQQRPVQQPMPQPVPEAAALDLPWQPADGQQLSKLMAGLSQATQDFFSGKILGDTFGQVKQQYMQRIGPLQARQQAQQQKAEQKAIRDAMQQQAMARVLQQKDQEHWASGFQGTVAHYVDQLTGKVTRFFNNGKSVEQVKEDKEPEIAALPLGGSSPATMLASLGALVPGQTGAGDQGGTPEEIEWGGGQGPPTEPGVENLAQFGQRLEGPRVYNSLGQDITGKTAPSRGQRDVFGRLTEPMPGPEGEAKGTGLSTQQIQEMYRRARQAYPPPQNAGPHQMLAYQHQLDHIVNTQVSHHHQMELSKEIRRINAEEHQRKEAAATTEHQRQEQATLNRQKAGRDEPTMKLKHDILTGVTKEAHALYKEWVTDLANIGKKEEDMPEDIRKLKDPKKRAEWIHNEYTSRLNKLGIASGDMAAAPAPGSKPAPEPTDQARAAAELHAKLGQGQVVAPAGAKPAEVPAVGREQIPKLIDLTERMISGMARESPWTAAVTDEFRGGPYDRLRKMKAILKGAHNEGRDLTPEEIRSYVKYHGELPPSDVTPQLALRREGTSKPAAPPTAPVAPAAAPAAPAAAAAAPAEKPVRVRSLPTPKNLDILYQRLLRDRSSDPDIEAGIVALKAIGAGEHQPVGLLQVRQARESRAPSRKQLQAIQKALEKTGQKDALADNFE